MEKKIEKILIGNEMINWELSNVKPSARFLKYKTDFKRDILHKVPVNEFGGETIDVGKHDEDQSHSMVQHFYEDCAFKVMELLKVSYQQKTGKKLDDKSASRITKVRRLGVPEEDATYIFDYGLPSEMALLQTKWETDHHTYSGKMVMTIIGTPLSKIK